MSKAIADRIDAGLIAMKTRLIDDPILDAFEQSGYPRPNYVMFFYKMRRGKYAGTKLWCNADLGTCRVKGLFLTDASNNLIPMEGTDIRVVSSSKKSATPKIVSNRKQRQEKKEESAF